MVLYIAARLANGVCGARLLASRARTAALADAGVQDTLRLGPHVVRRAVVQQHDRRAAVDGDLRPQLAPDAAVIHREAGLEVVDADLVLQPAEVPRGVAAQVDLVCSAVVMPAFSLR